MRVSRITAVAVALLGVVAFGDGTDAQQCPKGKLRLYTSWPMQGAMIPEGTGMKNGVDLAVSEVGGVVAGYCIEVVNLDDASPQTGKWDGAVEAENANKAVGDPLAIVYIGTYNSGAAKVSIPITNRAHMAQVTPANTYPGLTKKRGAAPGEPEIYRPTGLVNYFRPVPADDIQGAVGAKWAKRLGAKKVYVLNDQELYGKGIADVFEATAKKIGLPVVANEGIDWKQPDQKPVLTKIRASGADLIYLGGVIETGAQVVIRQMKEVGLTAPRTRFMGPDGLLEEELLKGATYRKTDITFDGSYTLDLGGVHVQLLAVGPTHTRGDTVVFVEDDRTLFAGDVVMSAFPAFASPYSSVRAWLAALNRLEALNPEAIVPSHGRLGDKTAIGKYREYLQEVQSRVRELKRQGKSIDDAAQIVQTELQARFSGMAQPARIAGAARAAYSEETP